MKIFIVDDSEILRQRLKRLIATAPMALVCGEAGTINDAVKSIKHLKPNLIILDIQLPSGLGFDVFDQVISDDYKPECIVLTNYPTSQFQKMCDERHINYFFDKTNDFEKIVPTIKSIIENESKKSRKKSV